MTIRFSAVHIQPIALRTEDAAYFIGISTRVLERCRAAGWITPSVAVHRMTLYRVTALELLLNRIEREGLPPETVRGGGEA
jgi:hypothetical protein